MNDNNDMGPVDGIGLGDVEPIEDAATHGIVDDDLMDVGDVAPGDLPMSVAGAPGWEKVPQNEGADTAICESLPGREALREEDEGDATAVLARVDYGRAADAREERARRAAAEASTAQAGQPDGGSEAEAERQDQLEAELQAALSATLEPDAAASPAKDLDEDLDASAELESPEDLDADLQAVRELVAQHDTPDESQADGVAELLEIRRLLAQREAELAGQDAKIASLKLENAGLRDQLRDLPRQHAAPATGLSVVAGSLEIAPTNQQRDIADRLRARLDESGRALAEAREEIRALSAECDRLRQRPDTAPSEPAESAAPNATPRGESFFGRVGRLLRKLAGHPDADAPAAAQEGVEAGAEHASYGGEPGSEVPTVVVPPHELTGRKATAAAGASVAGPRSGADAAADGDYWEAETSPETALRRYLIALDPDDKAVHELTKPRMYVGRGREADLRLNDATVSRLHAVIAHGHGATVVEDASSTNGLYVEDRRVRRAMLKDGDSVTFGTVRFQYRVGPGPG